MRGRRRPEFLRHVWAYDFVEARTHGGRKFRILIIIDDASRECLAPVIVRQLRHKDVLAALAELFIERGPPAHIRSDNGSEFITTAVQAWLAQVGVRTFTPRRARPGTSEGPANDPGDRLSEGGLQRERQRLGSRNELLNGEIFHSLAEAKVLVEAWWRHYNTVRPHSSVGYRPPAPEAATPPWPASGSAFLHFRPAMAAQISMH